MMMTLLLLTIVILASSVNAFFTPTTKIGAGAQQSSSPSSWMKIASPSKKNALLSSSSSQRSSTMTILLFSTVTEDTTTPLTPSPTSSSLASSSSTTVCTTTPIFDFSLTNLLTKQKSANSFERIDDAIMGGISTSTLRNVPNAPYAIWSGICRTEGGGFCGVRTLPFGTNPSSSSTPPPPTTTTTQSFLNATGQDGVYIDCQLTSDNEAYRRVWKMTLRTEASRGEKVYQAEFNLQEAMNNEATATTTSSSNNSSNWARVMIPFTNFQLVRGPRLIPNSPNIDVSSNGIYQIGMTMSKFKIAINTTEIDNFRSGYFELQIQRIGFYKNSNNNTEHADVVVNGMMSNNINNSYNNSSSMMVVPDTLSKSESMKQRPIVLKLLLPIIRLLLGTEQTSRRKSAMKILRTARKMSRLRAIQFGFQYHYKSYGSLGSSIGKTLRILIVDAFRAVIRNVLMISLVYPLRLMGAIITRMKRSLGMKVEPSLRE